MITIEQISEAAASDNDLIRRIDAITVAHQYTTSLDDLRMFAEMRDIPTVTETAEPLDLSNILKHAFLSGIVAARNILGYDEINGPELWLDYDPTGEPSYARILSALTIHPADPLSDPRVKALVESLKTTKDRLSSMAHDQYDGVWTASDFEDETRDADAALTAIGGEA